MTTTPSGAESPVARTFAVEGGLSASTALGFGIAIAAEGLGFYVFLAPRVQILAWLVVALNVAGLVWMWRDYVAAKRSVLRVTAHDVDLSIGRARCRFPRSVIESVEPATWRSVPDFPAAFASATNPMDPNVLIVFREPVILHAPYGMTRRITRLTLRVQDPEGVINALRHPD